MKQNTRVNADLLEVNDVLRDTEQSITNILGEQYDRDPVAKPKDMSVINMFNGSYRMPAAYDQ